MSIITDPLYRERVAPDVIVGETINSVLGEVTPDQAPLFAQPSGFYKYHQGDIFFPGAPMWVLEQTIETPLMAQWGNGLLLAPNRGFQAFPPIPPITTPDNLVRVATPWGMASPQWGINPTPEYSSEAQDVAGFTFQPNVNFLQNAPPYSLQTPTGDYGTPTGLANNAAIAPQGPVVDGGGDLALGVFPLGINSSESYSGVIFEPETMSSGPLNTGGATGDY